jgi:hypothetical protein
VSHEQSTGHHVFSVFSTFRDARKYLRDYLRHQLRKEMQLSSTLPVGLTPDQNQERPEAIHAGGSCSGIEDADEVQCWVSRPSTATRLQHWKEALEATQTPKERTIIDARYVECFTFCRHVLLQCTALCCDTHASHRRRQHLRVQSVSQAWLAGLGCLSHTVATGSTAPRFWDRSPVQP